MREDDTEHREIGAELAERYQIVRTLGRGAFGTVYLARERQLHRMVAIKVLHADRAGSDTERERLLREARTVAALSHPAIVPILAFGETASTVYLVMPYVAGETLADRLHTDERVAPDEVRRILIEVADALAYAHGEGVLHRDLKPENVLLERAGAVGDDVPPRVRLIDFGVAAFPGRDRGVGATHETWGTLHFLAPEQALGEPELDPRSELYSLGVLGFLLLGGRLPFEATSPTARLKQQQKGPAVPLSVCAPGAPKDLVAAIERCLAFEPDQRWRRARDLRDALVRGAAPTAVLAPISLVRQRLRSAGRRLVTASESDVPGRPALGGAFSGLGSDVRFAVRTLRKTPGFTAAVIATLAIGVGATTAIFSAVEALVLRKLPVPAPEALVMIQEDRAVMNVASSFGVSLFRYDRYLAYREATEPVLAGLAAQENQSFSVRFADEARTVVGLATSGNYFEVLGVRPALGSFYSGSEDRPGQSEPVVVVGHRFWQRELAGDRDVIGKTLFVDSRPLTIIGVAPVGFNGGFASMFASDVWVPIATYLLPPPATRPAPDASPRYPWVNMFGRLRAGIDSAGATAVLEVTGPRVPTEDPRTRIDAVWVEPLTAVPGPMRSAVQGFMTMLLVVAGLVLAIAAANSAGMLLARAEARRREIATRRAVGASRARLARQMLVESMLLCTAAGVAAVLLTWWLTRLLNSWEMAYVVTVATPLTVNAGVLGVALVCVLGTGFLAGVAPAIQGTGMDLAGAMKEGGPQSGRRTPHVRNGFVVAQIALSVVVLGVAGLFARSFIRSLAIDPGFDTTAAIRTGINLGQHGYDAERARALRAGLLERLQARPDVVAAAFGQDGPLTGSTHTFAVWRTDRTKADEVDAQWGSAGTGLLELLRVPLRAGRTFTSADTPTSGNVAVINETLVHRLWPGEPVEAAIGRRFRDAERSWEVIGVMANGKYSRLHEPERGYGYFALTQFSERSPVLYVRGRSSSALALQAVRQELAALDPNVGLDQPASLESDVARYLIPHRLASFLIGAFGLVGLVLAATGLYGVLAFGVTRRLREFGIRIALGARAGHVVEVVLRQSFLLVAIGLAIGVAGAVIAGRLISEFLVGSSTDPLVIAVVALILFLVALLASAIPARRAAGADPMVSLRAE